MQSGASGQDPDPGLCLYRAALAGDLVAMATALAQGAEVNRSVSGEEGRTALMAAAAGVMTRLDRRGSRSGPPLTRLLCSAGVPGGLRVPAAQQRQHQPPRPARSRSAARRVLCWPHGVMQEQSPPPGPGPGPDRPPKVNVSFLVPSQVCLLLKRGANQYAADERGQDPLAIAMETAHADIVTL